MGGVAPPLSALPLLVESWLSRCAALPCSTLPEHRAAVPRHRASQPLIAPAVLVCSVPLLYASSRCHAAAVPFDAVPRRRNAVLRRALASPSGASLCRRRAQRLSSLPMLGATAPRLTRARLSSRRRAYAPLCLATPSHRSSRQDSTPPPHLNAVKVVAFAQQFRALPVHLYHCRAGLCRRISWCSTSTPSLHTASRCHCGALRCQALPRFAMPSLLNASPSPCVTQQNLALPTHSRTTPPLAPPSRSSSDRRLASALLVFARDCHCHVARSFSLLCRCGASQLISHAWPHFALPTRSPSRLLLALASDRAATPLLVVATHCRRGHSPCCSEPKQYLSPPCHA